MASVSSPIQHQRRSGEVSCDTPPCAVCTNGRQTGDADGNCLFDVRDVTYQRSYLNILASDPSSPSLNVLPIQSFYLDSDQNGQINSQDVAFLLNVNFGLYYFLTGLTVTPVSYPSCLLNITVRMLTGGADVGDSPAACVRAFAGHLACAIALPGDGTEPRFCTLRHLGAPTGPG
jgi:hypothetical protein